MSQYSWEPDSVENGYCLLEIVVDLLSCSIEQVLTEIVFFQKNILFGFPSVFNKNRN